MVGIVLVSHSSALAIEVARLAHALAPAKAPIAVAGGTDDNTMGTSHDKIRMAVEVVDQGDGVVILADVGSSVFAAKTLVEDLGDDSVVLADAPLVEGAVAAAVLAGAGASLQDVLASAEEARDTRKF
jgi:dihydroxyacetone kinase phosphotransfer subunit